MSGAAEKAEEPREATRARANFIGAPQFFNLNQACAVLVAAFPSGAGGCYLVGSAISRRDYRDVDVRMILTDEEFDHFFRADRGHGGGYLDALWSLMCTSIALWLAQQSGLPIDFQIQRMSNANADHPGERQPLGLFRAYPGDLPSLADGEAGVDTIESLREQLATVTKERDARGQIIEMLRGQLADYDTEED